MSKPRKHRFVTECIKAGHSTMTVWPSDGEQSADYEAKVEKIKNDPRVVNVSAAPAHANGFVFTIDKAKA